MRTAVCLALISLLSACAMNPNEHTLVVLKNPQTKEVKECRGNALASWNVYAETEACAQAYEKAGFVRVGSY